MRMVVMLIALLIIGLLIYKQIDSDSIQPIETESTLSDSAPPKIPTKPDEIKKFDSQMNEYMKKEAEKRDKAIENATSQ